MVLEKTGPTGDVTRPGGPGPGRAARLVLAVAAALGAGGLTALGAAPFSSAAAVALGASTATGVLLILLARWVEASAPGRAAADRRRVASALDGLAREHVVVHGRRLPRTRLVVDHLVIGPTGVWVIASAESRTGLRAETVRHQAAAVARRLGRLGPEAVRPVLVATGEAARDTPAGADVTVVGVEALAGLVGSGPAVLTPAEVRSVATALRLPHPLTLAA